MVTNNKETQLTGLQLVYSQRLPEKLAAINNAYIAACHGQEKALQQMHYLVHSIVGSAGTFGYAALGSTAQLLEKELAELAQKTDVLGVPQRKKIQKLLDDMMVLSSQCTPRFESEVIAPSTDTPTQHIIIIEDDVLLAQEMASQLAIYGWHSSVFHNAKDAKEALCSQNPVAVIVDIRLPEGLLAGTELIQQIRFEHSDYIVPTIVISSNWDWPSRLSAARAGADAYLVKPLDFTLLNEKLDCLTKPQDQKPYQVLVIDDEPLLCQHYSKVLTEAGMHVVSLEDPALLLSTLNDFSPDLILLDLYLTHCNGIEVAKIIRQDNKFTDLSIVFLSSEIEENIQLIAMKAGADDFLHKPIEDAVLIKAVSMRIARFRALRELTRQDRMTGLLNQIAFHLQLEFEIGRIQRSDEALSVVVLDIDKFKHINDEYGHPVGDAVIQSLARVLKKRLRRTDVIGRLGGDEFGIIMTDTSPQVAANVLDELRVEFTKLRHFANQSVFTCTFSAGVAGFQHKTSLDDVLQAADDALYVSKKKGRNQVSLHTP